MIETEVKVMNFVDIKFKAMDFMEIKVKVTNVTGRVVNAIHFTEIIIGHGHGRIEINFFVNGVYGNGGQGNAFMEIGRGNGLVETELSVMDLWKEVMVMDLWKQRSRE